MNGSTTPWKDEKWLPGVLNKKQLLKLIEGHIILGIDSNISIDEDASALDLHLTDKCYTMHKGSIKPFNFTYDNIISNEDYAIPKPKDHDGKFTLDKGECYIFEIQEKLNLCKTTPLYGQATAKSSIGRLDVIARLIVDGMSEYEKFNPDEIDSGKMFLEITPITFAIRVKSGTSMAQLRFFYGKIEHSIINDEDFIRSVLNLRDNEMNHGTLSVDISNIRLNGNLNRKAAAYETKNTEDIKDALDLEKKAEEKDKYAQEDFWVPKESEEKFNIKSLVIEKDKFYILRSKERISLPKGVCIYCRAMDETLGEMRIHYAGFVHPLFGFKRSDNKKGTPLIFEVRGHNVKVLLTHGEILARLFFYRMSENVDEDKYSRESGGEQVYNNQELTLSNLFRKDWED